MLTKVTIKVSRAGNNVFVDGGIYGQVAALHVVPALIPEDLVIEPGRRFWVRVSTYGRYGMEVEILRKRDGRVLKNQKIHKKSGIVNFNLWEILDSWE